MKSLFLYAVASMLLGTQASSQISNSSLCRPTLAPRSAGPQVADTNFRPSVYNPAFPVGQGPRVLLDEAHFNFHTVDGRYAPFARLLRRDGFLVDPLRQKFTGVSLSSAKVLVIANAMAERNKDGDWTLPTPSAFAREEIEAVRQWVASGGSLFLIADHMPFGGAAADLASAFGVYMTNGYATDRTCSADEFLFQRNDGSLSNHPITRGRNARERVDRVTSFTGQGISGQWSGQPSTCACARNRAAVPEQSLGIQRSDTPYACGWIASGSGDNVRAGSGSCFRRSRDVFSASVRS